MPRIWFIEPPATRRTTTQHVGWNFNHFARTFGEAIFGDVVGAFTIDLTLFVSHTAEWGQRFGVLKTLWSVDDRSIGSINKFYVAQIRQPGTQSEIYSNLPI